MEVKIKSHKKMRDHRPPLTLEQRDRLEELVMEIKAKLLLEKAS